MRNLAKVTQGEKKAFGEEKRPKAPFLLFAEEEVRRQSVSKQRVLEKKKKTVDSERNNYNRKVFTQRRVLITPKCKKKKGRTYLIFT